MKQLREFAQQKSEFDKRNAELVAISVDDLPHAEKVYTEILHRAFPVLSDPGAKVIREYGLLHAKGHFDDDIAIRTVVLIDGNGEELFRRASKTVMEYPHPAEILARLR
ncbi:MAG: hypothetical protein NVS9B15_19700 [Acidobacteriaceae bacterium]